MADTEPTPYADTALSIYRAGWPSKVSKPKKFARWWAWIGPYVIGQVDRWDAHIDGSEGA